MIGAESQCFSCAHYIRARGASRRTTPTCAAFPRGIPDEVFGNLADHREPYPGDRGVRWSSDGRPFPEESVEILRRLL